MSPAELKTLGGRIQRVQDELNDLRFERQKLDGKIKRLGEDLQLMEKRMQKSSKKVHVTEHAILRYLERINRLNIQNVIQEIAPSSYESVILMTNGTIKINNSHMVSVRDGVITTVGNINKAPKTGNVKPWAEIDEE